MDKDPSKKESKGKKILRRTSHRNSKTSNTSQHSCLESDSSRIESYESEGVAKINDDVDVPGAAGSSKDGRSSIVSQSKDDEIPSSSKRSQLNNVNGKKIVDIKEELNEVYDDTTSEARNVPKSSSDLKNNIHPSDVTESKKSLKRKIEEESAAGTSGASTGASDTDADDKDSSKDKKKKNRCAVCRKKVGLTGFECRCGGLFCAVHRYSDKHECSFDYRELGAQEIRRNNPVVVSQKIHKI